MWNQIKTVVFCLVAVQIMAQFVTVECKAGKPISKGRGRAFGAGIAAGGLAGVLGGAAIGHVLTKNSNPQEIHHHHHIVTDSNSTVPNIVITNPAPIPPQRNTIIEKGEVMPNGCYKQTVKEPDQYDSRKYTETEQLICPQNLPTVSTATFTHLVPAVTIQQMQPVVPAVHMITVPVHIQPAQQSPETATNLKPNSTLPQPNPPIIPNHTAPGLTQTPQPVHAAAVAPLQPYAPTPSLAAGIAPGLSVMPLPQPSVVQPIQPVIISANTPAPPPPQVIVLSKTSGFYGDEKKKRKNTATTLLTNSFGFLLSVIIITGFF